MWGIWRQTSEKDKEKRRRESPRPPALFHASDLLSKAPVVALILLFCYASLAICFLCLSIMCAPLTLPWHMNGSHFPYYCVVVTSKHLSYHLNSQSQRVWKGGGEIKAGRRSFRSSRRFNTSKDDLRNKAGFNMWSHLLNCERFDLQTKWNSVKQSPDHGSWFSVSYHTVLL